MSSSTLDSPPAGIVAKSGSGNRKRSSGDSHRAKPVVINWNHGVAAVAVKLQIGMTSHANAQLAMIADAFYNQQLASMAFVRSTSKFAGRVPSMSANSRKKLQAVQNTRIASDDITASVLFSGTFYPTKLVKRMRQAQTDARKAYTASCELDKELARKGGSMRPESSDEPEKYSSDNEEPSPSQSDE
jgi:hypothetical protein